MTTKNEQHDPKQKDVHQASTIIALTSIVGLTICFVAGAYYKASVPPYLYAIFGGGILGTDNVIRLLKSVFRIGNGK